MAILKTTLLAIAAAVTHVQAAGPIWPKQCTPASYQCGDNFGQDFSSIFTCNGAGYWVKSAQCGPTCCRQEDKTIAYCDC